MGILHNECFTRKSLCISFTIQTGMSCSARRLIKIIGKYIMQLYDILRLIYDNQAVRMQNCSWIIQNDLHFMKKNAVCVLENQSDGWY